MEKRIEDEFTKDEIQFIIKILERVYKRLGKELRLGPDYNGVHNLSFETIKREYEALDKILCKFLFF